MILRRQSFRTNTLECYCFISLMAMDFWIRNIFNKRQNKILKHRFNRSAEVLHKKRITAKPDKTGERAYTNLKVKY